MTTNAILKTPAETILVEIDFSKRVPTGDSISAVPQNGARAEVFDGSAAAELPTISDAEVVAGQNKITLKLSGGADEKKYLLRVKAATARGLTLEVNRVVAVSLIF